MLPAVPTPIPYSSAMNGTALKLCPGCFAEKAAAPVCPACGYDESLDRGPLVLPPGTLLQGQYWVGKVLGKPGGFGITYLALDTGLQIPVAIKEFLPRELAGREAGSTTVKAHSREDSDLFQRSLQDFLDEARRVAKFDHANIVRVRYVFEANGTAYMVMDYYEGETLAQYLKRHGRLPERSALDIMIPILDGLREVHGMGWIHRDIKPQNVYLTAKGGVIILDFGLARHTIAEQSKSLSVFLTPGYAPFEQYHRRGHQGPWTDVYASAAVLYEILTGEAPPDAPERFAEDHLVPPKERVPELSDRVSEAVWQALIIDYKKRPQTIAAFQAQLLGKPLPDEGEAPATAASWTTTPVTGTQPVQWDKDAERSALVKRRLAWGGLVLVVLSALMAVALNRVLNPDGDEGKQGHGPQVENGEVRQSREAELQAQEVERRRQAQEAERQAQEAERQRQAREAESQAQEAERQRQAEESARRAQEAEQQAQEAERQRRAERQAQEAEQRRLAQEARQRRQAQEARARRQVGESAPREVDSDAEAKRRLQEQLNRDVMTRPSPFR